MKHLFTLFVSLVALGATAQTIDNGSFESWSDFGTYKQPIGWNTNNSYLTSSGIAVYDTSDAYSGDSAAVVQSVYSSAGSVYYGGILTNGSARNDSLGLNGVAINYRPQSFNGYYKYEAAAGGDTALVVLYMYRFDSGTNKDSLIATGNARLTPSASYQQFGFQILNADALEQGYPVPDSYVILITSTNSLADAKPSKLIIDDLSFEGIVSAPTLEDLSDVTIYPNPVEDHFVVSSPKHGLASVSIINAEGRQVQYLQANLGSNNVKVTTHMLSRGFYYVKLQFENGAVETRFITVTK